MIMSKYKSRSLSDDSEQQSQVIPELDPLILEKLQEIPEALKYVEKLQRTLKKLVNKIRKLKKKKSVSL